MDKKVYDFSGYATKHDIRCSDGRTIRKGAFKENDGTTVPLVWNHDHKNATSVLGHALLEDREEGVYAYCSFNNNDLSQKAKEMVKHGDIRSLSIYANNLKQNGDDVIHGRIREVSLVLAGANMGAYIDTVIAHSDDHDEEAMIFHPYDQDNLEIYHSEENNTEDNKMAEGKEKTVQDIYDAMTDEQKDVVAYMLAVALEKAGVKIEDVQHSEESDSEDQSTTQEDDQEDENSLEHQNTDNMEDNKMKENVFDKQTTVNVKNVISHSDFLGIIDDAQSCGSLRKAVANYVENNKDTLKHSITDVGNLFPEFQNATPVPETISRKMEWVSKVMNSVHKTPFSKVKSTAIDITADTARARGYVKGNLKATEVVAAIKRTTSPCTIYKKQAMDRDDVIDITDFDVIAWIKQEMRVMLEEEIARCILIGDGRDAGSDDKISADNIRPVLGDNAVYTIKKELVRTSGYTDVQFAAEVIDNIIAARKDYKGSGSPTFYCGEDLLTNMLLIKDTNGHYLYKNEQELAQTLRAKEIVSVPVMDGHTRSTESNTFKLLGLLVNLGDYNLGADKGGRVSLFDDFDIDYNKEKYLIETRCSGANIKPYSAISFEEKTDLVQG